MKVFYLVYIPIDILFWFVLVPFIISMQLAGVLFILEAPTILEWLGWQVIGFGLSLPAIWIAIRVSNSRAIRKFL